MQEGKISCDDDGGKLLEFERRGNGKRGKELPREANPENENPLRRVFKDRRAGVS